MSLFSYGRGQRPFPLDKERHERCLELLRSQGMTVTELAMHLGVNKAYISRILSGRDLSEVTERRIAVFFGVPAESLFPPRTVAQLQRMREAENAEKALLAQKKQERMELRKRVIQGVA